MQNKNCPKCENELPISEFYKRPNGNHHSWCKSCKNKSEKERRLNDKELAQSKREKDRLYGKNRWADSEVVREKQRAYQLERKFGITVEQYNEMLEKCSSVCEICGSSDTKHTKQKYLNVDHCHNTGKVRGLLCHACNIGLGKFEDNPGFLLKAINYLKEKS